VRHLYFNVVLVNLEDLFSKTWSSIIPWKGGEFLKAASYLAKCHWSNMKRFKSSVLCFHEATSCALSLLGCSQPSEEGKDLSSLLLLSTTVHGNRVVYIFFWGAKTTILMQKLFLSYVFVLRCQSLNISSVCGRNQENYFCH